MSVRVYPGIAGSTIVPSSEPGSPQFWARFTASLGVKGGNKVKMRRVRFSAASTVSFADMLLQGMRVLEAVDRCSMGQIMSVQMTLGHYVKDEIIEDEPSLSRHAFVIHTASKAKKRIHKLVIPWLKRNVSDIDVENIVTGADFGNLASIQLQENGKDVSCIFTENYKHTTLKNTLPDDDDLVDYGDTKDDPSDGGVDGTV